MAANVLCGRVHDRVRAEFKWTLKQWGRPCVVDDCEGTSFMRDRARSIDINDANQRVRRRLSPHQTGRRITDSLVYRARVAHVHRHELEATADVGLVDQRTNAEVHVVWDNYSTAGAGMRFDQCSYRRHSRRESDCSMSTLQHCHRGFESIARGV